VTDPDTTYTANMKAVHHGGAGKAGGDADPGDALEPAASGGRMSGFQLVACGICGRRVRRDRDSDEGAGGGVAGEVDCVLRDDRAGGDGGVLSPVACRAPLPAPIFDGTVGFDGTHLNAEGGAR